jgi:chemotaxis response regulator CheB
MTRVLVVSDRLLFGQGVEEFLRQAAGLDLVGIATSLEEALALIEKLHPDVVVFQCGQGDRDGIPPLMSCLRDKLVDRIVAVDPQENTLCVFSGKRRLVRAASDVLDAIVQPVSAV